MTSNEITLRFDIDGRRVVSMVGQMVEGFDRLRVVVGQGISAVQTSMGKGEAAVRGLGKGVEDTRRSAQNMEATTRSMDGSITRLAAHVAAATGAFQALRGFMDRVLDTTRDLEKAQRTLEYATGDGAAAMAFVRRTSQELGLELISTAQAYAKFASATRGTALEGYQTQAVFRAVASAATVMGLSADETSGALLALSQMVSKGKVAAEELRGQLGERLPGAFGISARAMGKTTQEFDKMLQEGKVLADDFLPKFARELKATLGDQTYLASLGPTAQVNRLKNAFTDLLSAIGKSGPLKQASQDMGDMAQALKDASENGVPRELGRFLASGISVTKNLASALWACRQEVLGLGAAYGVLLAMRVVGGVGGWIKAKMDLVAQLGQAQTATIQTAIAEAGLTYQTNMSAAAQVKQAQALVASRLALIGARMATGELTLAEAIQERQALTTTQAELAKAAAIAAGGRAAGAASVATRLLGGPMGWITLLLTVGVGAWAAWGGAAQTATDKALQAAEKAERSRQTYESLSGEVTELNRVLADSKAKADDKRRAQEQLNTTVQRLLDIYPDLNKFIKKEGENYEFNIENQKKFTESEKKKTEAKVNDTKATLENIKAEAMRQEQLAEIALRDAGEARSDAAALAAVGKAQTHFNRAAKQLEIAKEQQKAVDRWQAELNRLQAEERRLYATSEPKATKPPEESTTALERLKADLERRKLAFEKEAFDRGQLIEFSKAQEAKWLEENLGRYNLNAKERLQVEKQLFEAKRHAMAQAADAEVASLRRQMEEARGDADERIRLAEEVAAKARARHGEESKEAEAAAVELIRVRRDAWQDYLRLEGAFVDQEASMQLRSLENEAAWLERSKELGETLGMAYLVALANLEERKYQVQAAGIQKRIQLALMDPSSDPSQIEKMRAQLEDLKSKYNATTTGIGFGMQDEARKGSRVEGAIQGLDEYLERSRDKFESWKNTTGNIIRGVEGAFANFFTSLFARGMTGAQKWDLLWKGMAGAVVQALMQMAAQELVHWGLLKAKAIWKAVDTTSTVTQSKVKIAANTAEMGSNAGVATSNVGVAATGFFKAHSWIPWVGFALAAGFVASMLGLLKPLTGRAVGGRVDRPEITLLGEAGPEVVAPEHDFQDWAVDFAGMGARMAANIARQEMQARDYRLQAASYTQAAMDQGDRNVSEGRSFSGGDYIDLRGGILVADERTLADLHLRGRKALGRS